jgi:hypothetical protein
MAHHHAEASKIRRNVRTASRYMPVAIKRLEGKSLIGNPFWEGLIGSGQCPQEIANHHGELDYVSGGSFSASSRIGS